MHGSSPNPLSNKIIHADIRIQSIEDEVPDPVKYSASSPSSSRTTVILPPRKSTTISRYYDRVAVLLIKWSDELDELKTRAEVEELEELFRHRYHFETQITDLDVRSKPQHQLHRQITNFVLNHDGPNCLLIFQYEGHAVYREDQKYLQITATANPAFSKGFSRDAHANWNRAEDLLKSEDLESDVLVILDTCYASNDYQRPPAVETSPKSHGPKIPAPEEILPRSHVSNSERISRPESTSPRLFELLAACPIDQTTAAPGRYSFTRALIDTLGELLDEDEISAFTTLYLVQRINRRPERIDTPSQLWSRLSSRDGRHIRLSSLRIVKADSHDTRVSPTAVEAHIEGVYTPGVKRKLDASSTKDDVERPGQQFLFDDAVSDSAYESGFSDTASMWSVAFSEGSQSSIGELQHVTESATKKMAEVFWQSSELRALYSEASNRFSKDTFAKTHDDLLKTFFADLRTETANEKQLKTVRILRHRTHRQQVTEWIYNLAGPKFDNETIQARHNFLNQRETRDELLERFLQSQARPGKPVEEVEQEPGSGGDSSGEEDEEDSISLEELNAIVKFLVSGSSFEILKINLHGLAHPETAILEALRTGKVEVLQALLSKQFNRVAVGEYSWIQELDSAGYTKVEIAQLLAEETSDSPWIFFSPRAADIAVDDIATPQLHVAGCVHSRKEPGVVRAHSLALSDIDSSKEMIQELCGIAGVVPSSRDRASWNGSVQFTDNNDVATVTYAISGSHPDGVGQALLARSIQTLQSLLVAIGYLQRSDACCNVYSVIIHDEPPDFAEFHGPATTGAVHLRQISVECLLALLEEAQNVQSIAKTEQPERLAVVKLQQAALIVLDILGSHHFPSLERLTYDETLHLVALSAQFASLAFFSYSQAHIAPLQPFYLDTALNEISLIGIGDPQNPPFHIVAHVARLTCVGDMLRAPVTVFSIESVRAFGGSQLLSGPRANLRYDIVASAEDLIDTWDGGSLIVPTGDYLRGYYAIQLCGGIVSPVSSSHGVSTTHASFHWTAGNALEAYDRTFQVTELIRIGALVALNESCILDENQCWRSSAPAFEVLGVQDCVWIHDESQYGGQAGQYVLLQYNRTMHKIPGTTLKTLILRSIRNEAYVVRHSLNDLWGVQVSFCTGVARRVPLRALMADLMPVVVETMPHRRDVWKELNKGNRVIDAFSSDSVLEWFEYLDHSQSTFIDQLMREVLLALEFTGIDEERNELTVAWLYQHPPYRCFRVPCNDKKNSWMKVLSDSGDCATFAYIVTRCLETSSVRCRGPSPYWQSTAPLLETAVLRHNLQPSQPLGPLEHKKSYFFKKMDSLLQVTVERQVNHGPVSLYISPSSIPAKFKQRLYNMERMRNQVSRIRERRESGELGAEAVAICTKGDAKS